MRINADPLSHDQYKDLGEWCSFQAIGATLSPSESETAHGRKKGISMNGQYFVQIAGMPEPVEVKCLEMHVNEPDDTDENSILLVADVIFQHRVSIHHSGLG